MCRPGSWTRVIRSVVNPTHHLSCIIEINSLIRKREQLGKKESKEADGHVPLARSTSEKPTRRAEHLLHRRAFPYNYTHSMAVMAEGKAISIATFAKYFTRAWMKPRGGIRLDPGRKKNDLIDLPWRIGKAFEFSKHYLKT